VLIILTPPPACGVQSTVISMSVCLSVRWRISETTRPNFTKFSVHVKPVAMGQSSSDNSGEMKMLIFTTLCTSVFVDDVVSSVNGEYVVYWEAYIQGMSDSWRQHVGGGAEV